MKKTKLMGKPINIPDVLPKRPKEYTVQVLQYSMLGNGIKR